MRYKYKSHLTYLFVHGMILHSTVSPHEKATINEDIGKISLLKRNFMKHIFSFLSLFFIFFTPLHAFNKFLTLEEAFVLEADVVGNEALVSFKLADDIYVYQEQVSVSVLENEKVVAGTFTLPEGHEHDGEMVYFDGQVIAVPLNRLQGAQGDASFTLQVDYQGCSEKGLCYEPSSNLFKLQVDVSTLPMAADKTSSASTPEDTVGTEEDAPSTDPVSALLEGGNIFYIVVGFFIFGLLLSLTPCVFPMIPILSSVIVSHGSDMTTKKAFWLSMVYVQAMAVTYTIAGIIAGLTGAGVQAAFQTPWVVAVFAGVFVLLALSMFGLFEIQMPQSVQSYLNKKTEGSGKGYLSIAIMGLLSALIVGPCVAAPLAAALGFISQTGDALLGGIALYALSIGMGIPLLIVGTGAGKFMPRPGSWMDAVKSIFGVMMLAVAIWMLSRILEDTVTMFLWASLAIFIASSVGAFDVRQEHGCGPCYAAKKSLGLLFLIYGVTLFLGAMSGAKSMTNPLEKFIAGSSVQSVAYDTVTEVSFQKIHSIAELEELLEASKGKKVLLDFYADWCTSCKELEHITFADTQVKQKLAEYVLIQADVTANSEEEKALSKMFGLFGPPALIFYDESGQEEVAKRIIGFVAPEDLLKKL
jgi:thiol:disulfide interchange protein DsbD